MPIIVDGYNLLWAVQKLQSDASVDDVSLCKIIGEYLRLIGDNGEIVFDGVGPPDKSCFYNTNNMEIFFVGVGTDADTVIEDKIVVNSAPKRLTVVSSDKRIIIAARRRKAISIKSELFWSQVCKQLNRKKGIVEPPAKRGGLSETETDRWLDEFGF